MKPKKQNPKPGIYLKIELEDRGQDFTHFTVDPRTHKIVDTLPFQGFLWNGKTVDIKSVAPGNLLRLKDMKRFKDYHFKYPIVAVQEIDTRPVTKNELAVLLYTYKGHGRVNPYVIAYPEKKTAEITLNDFSRYSINTFYPQPYRHIKRLHRKELLYVVPTSELNVKRKKHGFDRLAPNVVVYRISEKGRRTVEPLFLAEELNWREKWLENNEKEYIEKKRKYERQMRDIKRKIASLNKSEVQA